MADALAARASPATAARSLSAAAGSGAASIGPTALEPETPAPPLKRCRSHPRAADDPSSARA